MHLAGKMQDDKDEMAGELSVITALMCALIMQFHMYTYICSILLNM